MHASLIDLLEHLKPGTLRVECAGVVRCTPGPPGVAHGLRRPRCCRWIAGDLRVPFVRALDPDRSAANPSAPHHRPAQTP